MANQPLPQQFRKALQDFSGGLNDFESTLIIKGNQFSELQNALVNNTGLLEKAEGYTVDGSPFPNVASNLIRMLVNYKRGTSVDKLVVAASDSANSNATYKVDYKDSSGTGTYAYIGHTTGTATFTNGSTAVSGSGTAWLSHLKAGDKMKVTSQADSVYAEISSVTNDTTIVLTANYTGASTGGMVAYIARIITHKDFIPQAVVFNNNLVYTNGSETPMTYNNTTVALITDAQAPKGKYIEAHKSRVFIASTAANPSSVYWSAVNDETSWDASSVEPVFPNDNGNIVAIKSFADSLIVFKDNGRLYQIVGQFDQDAVGEPDFIRKIDTPENIGAVSGYTPAVNDDGKMYFLTETGIYALDGKMSLEKVSWNIENTIANAVLESSAVSSKSYLYDTNTQWDTGTHSGTIARSTDSRLRRIADALTITDARIKRGCVAICIDSSNDIHVAYVSSIDNKSVKYKKWLASSNAVSVDETAFTADTDAVGDYTIDSVSIDVTSGGVAGIMFRKAFQSGASYHFKYRFTERTSGTWITDQAVAETGSFAFGGENNYGISLKYRTDNDPRAVICILDASTVGGSYMARTGSTWARNGNFLTGVSIISCQLLLEANTDPKISANSSATVYYIAEASPADGTTLASVDTVSTSGTDYATQLVKNATNYFTAYSDGGALKRRQHTGGTATTTLDSDTSNIFKGFSFDASYNNNYYRTLTSGSNRVEKFTFEGSSSVSNTDLDNTSSVAGGDRTMHRNGAVFATATFGANANEIIVRRTAYRGIWIGPEASDSTLTAWGTYSVTDQDTVLDTITHEIALASSSPPSSYSSITSGSVISTDATLIYNIPKITFVMGSFSSASMDSLELNYTGTGIDGKIPTGVVFDNEYYIPIAETGQTANSLVILLDQARAFTTLTPDVTFMCRYKRILYAGSSTNGDVYKFNGLFRHGSSAYTMIATTKEELLGSLELKKEVYKVYVLYEIQSVGTFDFAYRVDNFKYPNGASWVTTEVDQTTSGLAEIKVRDGLFNTIQFRVQNDESDSRVGIIGFVVIYSYANIR